MPVVTRSQTKKLQSTQCVNNNELVIYCTPPLKKKTNSKRAPKRVQYKKIKIALYAYVNCIITCSLNILYFIYDFYVNVCEHLTFEEKCKLNLIVLYLLIWVISFFYGLNIYEIGIGIIITSVIITLMLHNNIIKMK